MKLLFISQDKETAGSLFRYFTPLGYSIIHYTNPLKAIDNFKEIRPEVVIFNETDYPRHWKLAVQFLRQMYNKETSLFILIIGSAFPEEDLHKTYVLGVNGILRKRTDASFPLEDLEALMLHYKPSPHVRTSQNLLPLGNESMDFMFMNPENLQLVTARVLELSPSGAVVKPVEKIKTAGLKEGMEIKGCSLKTEEIILSLTVKIVKMNGIFQLIFLTGDKNWKEQLQTTIDSRN